MLISEASEIERVREKSPNAWISFLVKFNGSSPRHHRATMVVSGEGERLWGTVGGGALEHQICEEIVDAKHPFLKKYDLAQDLAMCCGGSVELFSMPLSHWPTKPAENVFVTWTGKTHLTKQEGRLSNGFVVALNTNTRLFVFGYGHVGKQVANLAANCDFEVIVVDDNETDALEGYVGECCASFHLPDVEKKFGRLTTRDFVLIMTRAHQIDETLTESVLGRPVGYLGVIGSKAKAARFRMRLANKGIEESQLARVSMPLGISIGAETPQEIAVAAVAELVSLRASR